MKNFEDLTYYELLEIPAGASFFEIRHAYKDALAIYNEDSLSTYSLFPSEQRQRMLQRIEKAFNTLIDEERRAEYDEKLVQQGVLEPEAVTHKPKQKSIPIFQTGSTATKNSFYQKIEEKIGEEGTKAIIDEIHGKELISGADLKRLRESIGIGLQEFFEVGRISVSMLQAIEGNQFHNLPSLIHLKNFLKTYAEFLHLNPKKVVDGYIINITLMQK